MQTVLLDGLTLVFRQSGEGLCQSQYFLVADACSLGEVCCADSSASSRDDESSTAACKKRSRSASRLPASR
jgi:hypothetical protein